VSAVATRRRGGQLALVTERTRRENFDLERLRRERSNCSDGGRLTLEQRLEGVWEGLRAAGVAECPVCAHRMDAAGDGVGRCGGCGTTLS
jgi:ribosomal protein L37AE/L43A